MFPWESSLTGIETSPGWKYGKHQVHITGDVAYTARLYWYATKDIQWLRHIGFDLIYHTADFWSSRVYYDKKKDQYQINYVMPPDEYQFPVDNSFYTNVVAKQNLEFALEVIGYLPVGPVLFVCVMLSHRIRAKSREIMLSVSCMKLPCHMGGK